jgi:phage portal protein BeeE
MLLGIPGDNTFANYSEAQRAFWRQTVLPLVSRMAKAFSAWLAPAWGGGLELRPDLDQKISDANEYPQAAEARGMKSELDEGRYVPS